MSVIATFALRNPSAAWRPPKPPPTITMLWVLIALPEGECVRLGARLEERDLQRTVTDGVVLAHELVHAGVREQAGPILAGVDTVRPARRLTVETHAEGNR